MTKFKFSEAPKEAVKPKDKNKALDEQGDDYEYVCVSRNKLGQSTYALKKKQ